MAEPVTRRAIRHSRMLRNMSMEGPRAGIPPSLYDSPRGYALRKVGSHNAAQNHILRSLSSESTPAGSPTGQCPFKFAVNSTIIQHLSAKASAPGSDGTGVGKRGMHSACGAFWNNEKVRGSCKL